MRAKTISTLVAVVLLVWAEGGRAAWSVAYDEGNGQLVLEDSALRVRIAGALGFTAGAERWKVVAARDARPERLGLLDLKENVQGYVCCRTDGGRVELLVYHRTAQAFEGVFAFEGTVSFRADSFACRTRATAGERVLSLASGPADSRLNDTLFAREEDLALCMDAANLAIATRSDGVYAFSMAGRIHQAAEAHFAFSLCKDYFRSRYVPYYRPIDRKRCPRPPTGWMSWNVYFDKATAEDNLAQARVGRRFLQPFGLEFWSIESWQDKSDHLPVSAFHNMDAETSPRKFPQGMKAVADEIRALGFRPGLWVAPFGTGNEAFYRAHKDWFLHRPDGTPVSSWNGRFTLDPTVPEALEHLRRMLAMQAREWGYEFFKIDGMSGREHGYCAHLYERPEIRAQFHNPECRDPFERCCKAFRDGIGPDRVFLACQGHFTGAEAAYADAARTGADIVHPDEPVKWANILTQARCTLNQVFVHNIAFWLDPDTLLVGDALDIEQARVTTTVVALPGQMMFAGDRLAALAPERMKLLQQALPPADVRPQSLYPYFAHLPVWNLKVVRPWGSWNVVALFNWSDAPQTVGFDMAELGEDPTAAFALYEFWTAAGQGVHAGRFAMAVPPRGVRLLAMHPATAHPQFLSSDRHITQGAVEMRSCAWDDAARALSGSVQAIGGFPLTLRFRVPEGYEGKGAAANGKACEVRRERRDVVAMTLSAEATREVTFRVEF